MFRFANYLLVVQEKKPLYLRYSLFLSSQQSLIARGILSIHQDTAAVAAVAALAGHVGEMYITEGMPGY